jgi:hypothetical protein
VRCVACNVILEEVEMVRRGIDSGEFIDLCTQCCAAAGIVPNDRLDLISESDSYVIDSDLLDDWYKHHTSILDEDDFE